MECTSNTRNLRRLRRRGKFDVEYTLILRRKMFIRWIDTFQRRIHVDSTSKFTLRLVRWIFLRRIDVDSTSKSISADMVYFSRRFNVEVSLFTRTVDSSTSNICPFHVDASPTVFVDFSTLNARRFNVEISLSTSNIRRFHVEVSHGIS